MHIQNKKGFFYTNNACGGQTKGIVRFKCDQMNCSYGSYFRAGVKIAWKFIVGRYFLVVRNVTSISHKPNRWDAT